MRTDPAQEGQFRLMVSYDAGWRYSEERRANTPIELLDRCRELDDEGWRWYIVDPDGNDCLDLPCAIHAKILGLLERAQ